MEKIETIENFAGLDLTRDEMLHDYRLAFRSRQASLIGRREVIDSHVLRIPNAYPIFEIGYDGDRRKICDYLGSFENLRVIGRGGMFQYFNMDHAMESGIAAAEAVMAGRTDLPARGREERVLAEASP